MKHGLLEEGELIEQGDEVWQAGLGKWQEYPTDVGCPAGVIPRRRTLPEPQGWIPVSTPPTKEDANKQGMVLWHLILGDGRHSSRVAAWNEGLGIYVTHWSKHLDDPEGIDAFSALIRKMFDPQNPRDPTLESYMKIAFEEGRKSVQS